MTKERQGVSVNAFAQAIGVTPKAVRDRMKAGKLAEAVHADGSLDEAHARALWFANVNPAMVRRRGSKIAEESEEGRHERDLRLDLLRVQLETAEVNLERLRATTVDKEDARRAVRGFARSFRDHMLRFPNRYGAQMAAELGVDTAAFIATLEARMREALVDASDNPMPFAEAAAE